MTERDPRLLSAEEWDVLLRLNRGESHHLVLRVRAQVDALIHERDDARQERDLYMASYRQATTERDALIAERNAARAALAKALHVIEQTTELFHPKYLLHTDALLKECRAALATDGA